MTELTTKFSALCDMYVWIVQRIQGGIVFGAHGAQTTEYCDQRYKTYKHNQYNKNVLFLPRHSNLPGQLS